MGLTVSLTNLRLRVPSGGASYLSCQVPLDRCLMLPFILVPPKISWGLIQLVAQPVAKCPWTAAYFFCVSSQFQNSRNSMLGRPIGESTSHLTARKKSGLSLPSGASLYKPSYSIPGISP